MVSRNNIVVITGVSASGKDYLLDRALSRSSPRTRVLPFGTLLFEKVQGLTGIKDRDELRSVPVHTVQVCAHEIISRAVEDPDATIINTHIAYRSGGGILVDPHMDRIVNPRDYVFVSTNPTEIHSRRMADGNRQRQPEDVPTIEMHQAIALGAVTAISQVIGAGLTVIENRIDNVAINVATIQEVVYG